MGKLRRIGGLAIGIILVGGVLVGCGGSSHPSKASAAAIPPDTTTTLSATGETASTPTTATTPAPGPTSAQLASELLSLSDLPAGWTSTPVQSASSGSFCNIRSRLDTGNAKSGDAEADFTNGNFPVFDELLAAYRSSPAQAFEAVVADLGQCTSFKDSGSTFTLGRMSFPAFGSESAAFRATGSVQNFTVGLDLVFVLKGNQVLGSLYGDLGTPDVTELESFTQKAVAKMP